MAEVGYAVAGGTRLSTNRQIHYRILPAVTGNMTRIRAYLDTNNVAVNALAGVYDSSAQDLTGVPTDLIAAATPVAVDIAAASPEWVWIEFADPIPVVAGTYYHLSVGTNNSGNWGLYYDDNNADNNSVTTSTGNVTSITDPADVSGPATDWDVSIYAVVEPAPVFRGMPVLAVDEAPTSPFTVAPDVAPEFGDYIYLWVAEGPVNPNAFATFTPPSGFTLLQEQDQNLYGRLLVYLKVADGTETDFDIAWIGGGLQSICFGVAILAGVDADAAPVLGGNSEASTSVSIPEITTTVDNSRIIVFYGSDCSNNYQSKPPITNLSGYIEAVSNNSTDGVGDAWGASALGYQDVVTAGVVSADTWTKAENDRSHIISIALAPAAGGGTPVSALSAAAVESLGSAQSILLSTIENTSSMGVALVSAMESVQSMKVNGITVYSAQSGVSMGSASVLENLEGLSRNQVAQFETRTGLAAVSRTQASILEALRPVGSVRPAQLESTTTLVAVSAALSTVYETLQRANREEVSPIAVVAGLRRSGAGTFESLAQLVITGPAALEILHSINQGQASQLEALALLRVMMGGQIEALGAGILPTFEDLELVLTGVNGLELALTDINNIN